MSTFAIRPHDQDDFADLPTRIRNEVNRWLDALTRIERGASRHDIARALGKSLPTVNRKVTAAKRYGWRGLVPQWKGPKSTKPEFDEYCRKLMEECNRNSLHAHRTLLEQWANREPIPGYEGHPGWPNLPRAFSQRSFYRRIPSNFELKAMRLGLGKALAAHGPKTFTTRAGLYPFQFLMFDDVDHDNFVHVLTAKQLSRVQEFGCLDVLSGDRFAWGARPALKRADGTGDELKEKNMRLLLAYVLFNFGYHPQGTTLVTEHGTAAIRGPLAEWLKARTDGKLIVRPSGIIGKEQAIAGMYLGRGGGNPRHKSPLESLHNLIHNSLQMLPGQTGRNVDSRPEQLDGGWEKRRLGRKDENPKASGKMGMLKEVELLLQAYQQLPEHLAKLLRFPTLEYHTQFLPVLHAIYDKIANRTWHNLQGWAECGFLTTDYRLSATHDQWMSQDEFLALDPAAQAIMRAVVKQDPRCHRPRKLSPREVRVMGQDQLIRPPLGMIAEMLYPDLHEPVRVADNYFIVQDITVQPGKMIFESRVRDSQGRETELRDRETYDVVINPFDTDCLWVYDVEGAFLGLASRVRRACRADDDAVRRTWGRNQQRLSDQLEGVQRRHADVTRDAVERQRINLEILSRPEDAALAEKAQAAMRDLHERDFYSTPQPQEIHEGQEDDSYGA